MSTRFMDIMARWQSRIEAISTANGAHHDIGQSVYVNGLQPVPLDDHNAPLPSTVLIEPGEVSMSEAAGEVRAATATLDAIFVRDVEVLVIWPMEDGSQWLQLSEEIGADVRAALFASQVEWRHDGVQRLTQTGQEVTYPESASMVLAVSLTFQLRYVET